MSSLKKIINGSSLVSLELLSHDILSNREYDKLYKYGSFLLKEIEVRYIPECNNDALKHIIDNCSDLNIKPKYGSYNFFTQMLVSHSKNYEIIKYIIENKNVNLEEKHKNNSTPIYFAYQHASLEIINLILNQNVKLEFKNSYGRTHEPYIESNTNLSLNQKKIIKDRIQSIINS